MATRLPDLGVGDGEVGESNVGLGTTLGLCVLGQEGSNCQSQNLRTGPPPVPWLRTPRAMNLTAEKPNLCNQ